MGREIETLEIFERLLPCSFNKRTTAYRVRCNIVPACINKGRGSIGYFSKDPRWAETPNISSATIIKLSFSLTLSNCFSWFEAHNWRANDGIRNSDRRLLLVLKCFCFQILFYE